MRFLRYLNPAYLNRIEREAMELRTLIERQQRAIRSYNDSIGRQAPVGSESETALRARIVSLEQSADDIRNIVGWALDYLRKGQTNEARVTLERLMDVTAKDQWLEVG